MSHLLDQLNTLSGTEFEKLCAVLISKMGFEVQTTKASGDGGIDLYAFNHAPLIGGKYIIQCKRYSGTVGEPILRDLYGVVMSERANKGVLIITGGPGTGKTTTVKGIITLMKITAARNAAVIMYAALSAAIYFKGCSLVLTLPEL